MSRIVTRFVCGGGPALFMGRAGIRVPLPHMRFARYSGVSPLYAAMSSSPPVLMTSGSSRHGNEIGIPIRKRCATKGRSIFSERALELPPVFFVAVLFHAAGLWNGGPARNALWWRYNSSSLLRIAALYHVFSHCGDDIKVGVSRLDIGVAESVRLRRRTADHGVGSTALRAAVDPVSLYAR